MILFMSGASAARRKWSDPRLGWLLTPSNGNSIAAVLDAGVPWATDNDCFQGLNERPYRRMLARVAGASDRSRLVFVTVTDVVANASATLELWHHWMPVVRDLGLPPAFVAQDGLTLDAVPWSDLAAIFIGGSDRYKLVDAVPLILEAKRRRVWVHAGRVCTLRRARLMDALGVDSFDGSSFSKWPDKFVPWMLRHTSVKQHAMMEVICSS